MTKVCFCLNINTSGLIVLTTVRGGSLTFETLKTQKISVETSVV